MASINEVEQALLDKMAAVIAEARNPQSNGTVGANDALMVIRLAEAHAWLTRPAQPHGGAAGAGAG